MKHPLMRYHGAKFRLAPWIMSFFPDHYTYCEPYGGAAGVLIQKPRSMSEVYNDLDGDIVNVFRVMQNESSSSRLIELLRLTPYARKEFELSYEPTDDPIEQARRTLIRAHLGFGSAGATKPSTGFRIDSARKYGTAAHLWARYPDSIVNYVDRLADVVLENKPAIEVIDNHDRVDTLFYVDPPYVTETRVVKDGRCYNHEMDDEQHIELLEILKAVKGMVVLSGYETDIYNDMLSGWHKHTTSARISAGRGTRIRIETVWVNPAAVNLPGQTVASWG